MSGLFAGTPLERPVTCEQCEKTLDECTCPRDGDGRVLMPSKQHARVRREKRRKGKVVTAVSGLDPVASDLDALVKELKTKCGAGGTTTDEGIEIQGDHRDAVADVLRAAGYPVKVIA